MEAPRLVLFDFDGTLVDSQHSIVASFAEACRVHAIANVDPTAIRQQIGLPLAIAIAESVPACHRDRAAEIAESYKLAHRALAAANADHDPLFPGAADALVTLHDAGAVLGIATGKGRRGLVNTLTKHRLVDRFTVLRTADDGPGKPDPFMIRSALAETGIDAADAIMIGDTVFDMAMARNAGVPAIGVAWGYHQPDQLLGAGALGVVESFDALVGVLQERGFAA